MRVRIDIMTFDNECKSVELVLKDNKDFRRFAKKIHNKLRRNKYITIGGLDEAYTLKTSMIMSIHYEIIEKDVI